MYNLSVDVAHTFFVGDGQWLVHNASPIPCGPGGATGGIPKKGIYEFQDLANPGMTYVGQSGNIPRRLRRHVRKGRLANLSAATTTPVRGGKFQREIAEQNRINALGGLGGGRVSNKVNPIGPARVARALGRGLVVYPFYP
jgi:hypothetical protein